jgi:hypothetical protein
MTDKRCLTSAIARRIAQTAMHSSSSVPYDEVIKVKAVLEKFVSCDVRDKIKE